MSKCLTCSIAERKKMRTPKIEVSYDGKYPILCSGVLVVTIDGIVWKFGDYCLSSGGNVTFDEEWNDEVDLGPWSIKEWPAGFPEELKEITLEVINNNIEHGCCGGCV